MLGAMSLDEVLLNLLKLRDLLAIEESRLEEDLDESWIARRGALGHRLLDLIRGQHLLLDRQATHERYRLLVCHCWALSAFPTPALSVASRSFRIHASRPRSGREAPRRRSAGVRPDWATVAAQIPPKTEMRVSGEPPQDVESPEEIATPAPARPKAPDLDSSQRRHLRGLAHSLKPIIFVGEAGIGPALTRALDEALKSHELVKVRLRQPADKKATARELAEASAAALCGVVGHTVVLYRPNPDEPRIQLPTRD